MVGCLAGSATRPDIAQGSLAGGDGDRVGVGPAGGRCLRGIATRCTNKGRCRVDPIRPRRDFAIGDTQRIDPGIRSEAGRRGARSPIQERLGPSSDAPAITGEIGHFELPPVGELSAPLGQLLRQAFLLPDALPATRLEAIAGEIGGHTEERTLAARILESLGRRASPLPIRLVREWALARSPKRRGAGLARSQPVGGAR